MPTVRPAKKRNRAEGIARTLRIKILSGEFGPGDRLPTEQALAEAYGVNRATLREAVKKLEMLGLVTVQQRTGIRVRDYWLDAGIELLMYLMETAVATDRLDPQLLESVLEIRRLFYAEIARLTALRGQDDVLARLEERGQAIQAASTPEEFLHADLAFVEALALGSGNLVARLLFNTVAGLYRQNLDLFTSFYLDAVDSRKPFYRQVVSAIRGRDADTAGRLVQSGLEEEDNRLLTLARTLLEL
jgi:GntR family transcriptional repressor for pyruvate dehydrogenase complex